MSGTDMRRYLVAYDVPDDRRRCRIANTLSGFGDRVQYSVFVIDAAPVRFNRLRRALAELVIPTQDSILFCDLGLAARVEEARFTWIGCRRKITNDGSSFIV